MGPRLSVNRDLEQVFKDYIEQVKKVDKDAYDKEKVIYGPKHKPQPKPFHFGDEDIFDSEKSNVTDRKKIFRDCVNNLFRQGEKYGDFYKKILYLDCKYSYIKNKVIT